MSGNTPPDQLSTVLIDGDWLTGLFHGRGSGVPFDSLAILLTERCGPLKRLRVYTSLHTLDSREVKRLSALGLEIHATPAKGSTLDVQIAIDAIGFASDGDGIVLVSGDGDFVPLVTALTDKGTDLTIVTSRQAASIKLLDFASVRYLDLGELVLDNDGGRVGTKTQSSSRQRRQRRNPIPTTRRSMPPSSDEGNSPPLGMAQKHAFISYVREDAPRVDKLVTALRGAGLRVWRDKDELLPGQRWQDEIRTAIRSGSFFLACFSEHSETRERSYMREELTVAIEEMRLKPRQAGWFIPVKLGACEIPPLPVGPGEDLSTIHYADLSQEWATGVDRLIATFSLPQ